MSIKRRGFLAMLGAVATAPALPMAASAGSANVAGLAATHAKTYPFVSALGLSKRLDLPLAEAQKLLLDLSSKGMVGQVHSCATGPLHAASKVFKPTSESLIRAAQLRQQAKQARQQKLEQMRKARQRFEVDLRGLLRHLHAICTQGGMTVQPAAIGAAT